MTPEGDVTVVHLSMDDHLLVAVYRCDECRHLSTAHGRSDSGFIGEGNQYRSQLEASATWLPASPANREFPDVPEDIEAAASEAYQCLSIGAYRAAVMLARSVIEATAKAKGISKGLLWHKIEAMHRAGLVREHVKDAAHEVRHLGNESAHGDFVEPVSPEEADEVLQLMAEVLNEVFESPARVQRRRDARLAKEASSHRDRSGPDEDG